MPERMASLARRWRERNPGWDYRLWDREAVEGLVREDYPDYWNLYCSYSRPVQRADAARYFILDRWGGAYADLDTRSRWPLDELLQRQPGATCLVGIETVLTPSKAQAIGHQEPIRGGQPELVRRLANYFLMSTRRHPLWSEVFALMRERGSYRVHRDYDVLYTTGPDIITEAVARVGEVTVVDRKTLDRYASHRQHGSWRLEKGGIGWLDFS